MKELICKIFNHKIEYNFPSLPTRCYCKRCGKKWKLDYSGDIIREGPKYIEINETNKTH